MISAAKAAANRRYYQAHREELLVRQKEYNRQHADEIRATKKAHYLANRERLLTRQKNYQQKNREAVAERNRRWRQANADYRRHYERLRAARQTDRGVLTVPFSADQLNSRLSMFGFRCWMCGEAFEAIDHVKPFDAGGPHCLANIRPACRSCNSRKFKRWPYPTSTRHPMMPTA